ncbi:MAG TPA: ABC transporter substrate-binding protein [Myxococcales bacterium]|nr:ABC transporter substrate-binding protein [Myxococcales bacterium]
MNARWRGAAALTLLGALSGCPPAGVRGGGLPLDHQFPDHPTVEAKKDPAADDALRKAEQQATEAASKEKAAEVYLGVRKAYPETTASQEALYRAGALSFESGDFVNARKSFNELLFENPLFDKAPDAKRMLGLSALEVGAYRDAYHTLSSLAEHAQGDERRTLLEATERAAEGSLMFGEALRIAILFANEAKTPEEQKLALQRVSDLVEGKVAFVDVARFADEIGPESPIWPILTFKLARIYFHLRDWPRLNETLEKFLARAPDHPFAPEARALQERMQRGRDANARRVGVILPLTGRFQQVGAVVKAMVDMAFEGSSVELIYKDSQGDVNLAGKAVEDLVFDERVIAIIGPLLGDDARRAALVAEELQVPILTLSRLEGLTDIGPHVFRNMLTNSAQAVALAQYGTEVMGWKRFGLLYPNVPYGVELANKFWDQVLLHGGEIRAAESYDHDATAFTPEAQKLVGRFYREDRLDYLERARDIMNAPGTDEFHKRKAMEKLRSSLEPIIDFDALFIPDEWARVSLVAPALAVEDIITNACDPRDLEKIKKTTGKKDLHTVTLLGANEWSSPKSKTTGLPEILERGGKFVTCSVYVDGFFADSDRPGTKKFTAQFKRKFADLGRDPVLVEAYGYDAGAMMRSVIETSRPQTREDLREALAGLKNFEGACGKATMSDHREAERPLFFLSIDNKGVHELPPRAKAAGGS